ncbi:hypothetical protein OUZ56_002637 [Daphnia magna]|uniref:Uncharacterized protein n=1 Tax=Daphnia magna TaxID=35525 RepID=A0ABR0A6C0_9CRUS|nr:hypothetical protein OUZ56_002637 [Daphnia magna]
MMTTVVISHSGCCGYGSKQTPRKFCKEETNDGKKSAHAHFSVNIRSESSLLKCSNKMPFLLTPPSTHPAPPPPAF